MFNYFSFTGQQILNLLFMLSKAAPSTDLSRGMLEDCTDEASQVLFHLGCVNLMERHPTNMFWSIFLPIVRADMCNTVLGPSMKIPCNMCTVALL